MCIIELKDRPGQPLFHLEHYIEGKYIKYNSNSGFVRDDNIRLTPQVSLWACSTHTVTLQPLGKRGKALWVEPHILKGSLRPLEHM